MKIFQVLNGFCHWDATEVVPNLEFAKERYAPDIIFVEAPDYVFEGWGFDKYAEGDERFIKPTPPDGWLYDEKTGTFYQEGYEPPKSDAQILAETVEENRLLKAQVQALSDRNDFVEDILQEMALALYAE